MLRRTLLLTLAFAPVLSSGKAFAQAVSTIPLDLSRRQPRVRIAIGGVDRGEAIFDTGAFGATIARPLAEELGLPDNGPLEVTSGVGGEPIQAFNTRVTGVAINGVAIPDFDAAALPFVRPDTVVVLSPVIWSGQFVRLDFQNARLQILEKTSANIPPVEAIPYAGTDLPLPGIPVTLPGGVHLEGHLDTGSPAQLMLPREMADTLPLSSPLTEVGRARMINTERVIYRATLNGNAQVGPLTLTNPDIIFMEGARRPNIGMALLNQLNITLDPAERRLWVETHS
jgi:hypothetical protein